MGLVLLLYFKTDLQILQVTEVDGSSFVKYFQLKHCEFAARSYQTPAVFSEVSIVVVRIT